MGFLFQHFCTFYDYRPYSFYFFTSDWQVDVFSFGIVLWEILTGEEPYANMHYGAIIGVKKKQNLHFYVCLGCI